MLFMIPAHFAHLGAASRLSLTRPQIITMTRPQVPLTMMATFGKDTSESDEGDLCDPLIDSCPVGDPGDVECDEDGCYLMLDTVGDGVVDTVIPIEESLPYQDLAQRIIINPAFELVSVVSTILLIVTFAISYGELTPAVREISDAADLGCSVFFVLEFVLRWYAVGLARSHLLRPLTVLDFINLLPILVSPGLPYVPSTPLAAYAVSSLSGTAVAPLAPLRLLRAARILRLRRLLQPEELSRIAKVIRADSTAEVTESTRLALRLAFSALSIVVISAGLLWQIERASNPNLDGLLDAIYFSFSIITTVGLGDISPSTGAGRLVVVLEQVAAVTIIPLELAELSKALLQERGVFDATQEGFGARVRALDLRCDRCNLTGHESDSIFCRRCGNALLDR
jgi:voltage-gated potassium channel